MKLHLAVTLDTGEQFTVATNLYTMVAWERKYKRKASDMANGIGVEDLAFLAHAAAKDSGIVVPMMLDDFIKHAVTIEVVEEERTNPTEPGHTATH